MDNHVTSDSHGVASHFFLASSEEDVTRANVHAIPPEHLVPHRNPDQPVGVSARGAIKTMVPPWLPTHEP